MRASDVFMPSTSSRSKLGTPPKNAFTAKLATRVVLTGWLWHNLCYRADVEPWVLDTDVMTASEPF